VLVVVAQELQFLEDREGMEGFHQAEAVVVVERKQEQLQVRAGLVRLG
jgi:hypothetical protein